MWSKDRLLKAKRNIHFASVSLPDEYAVETPEIFPHWSANTQYNMGARLCYNDKLFFTGLKDKAFGPRTMQRSVMLITLNKYHLMN